MKEIISEIGKNVKGFADQMSKKTGELTEQISKKTGELTEQIGKKTDEIIEVQRLRSHASTLKKSNESDFSNMGKIVFTKYEAGETVDESLISFCEAIQERREELNLLEKQIAELKGKDGCSECGNEVNKTDEFCSKCGAKINDKIDSSFLGMSEINFEDESTSIEQIEGVEAELVEAEVVEAKEVN